jgi:hypothetical protein
MRCRPRTGGAGEAAVADITAAITKIALFMLLTVSRLDGADVRPGKPMSGSPKREYGSVHAAM